MAIATWSASVAVAAVATCVGCTSAGGGPSPTNPDVDGGRDAAEVRPEAGGLGHSDAASDAGTLPHDAAMSVARPADAGGPLPSSGLPPDDCYPACLWAINGPCNQGFISCTEQRLTDAKTVSCNLDAGWRRVDDQNDAPGRTRVFRDGVQCYRINYVQSTAYYYGAKDWALVKSAGGTDLVAVCSSEDPPGSAAPPAHFFNPYSAHCAPWQAPICTPGICE